MALIFLILFILTGVQGKNESDTRILQGRDAPEGAFPWQVSIRHGLIREYHFCGGSIIDKKWILTAAHCTSGRLPLSLFIVVGSNKLTSGGKRYNADKIIVHEHFNPITLVNDISLVRLSEEIDFNVKVQAIELDKSYITGPDRCVVTGWGYYNNLQRVPNQLQMLEVNVLTVEDCTRRLRNVRGPTYTKDALCSYNKRNQGICQGDSGGPLVRNQKLVGVVSYNIPCGKGYPDVYTRITSYLDWIDTNMKRKTII